MQRIVVALSCLGNIFLVNSEEENTCGKWLLPKEPVHFNPSHGSQWRLLATEGQKIDGTIIQGVPSDDTYPTVIRGHWAIGELEFYADPNCEGSKYPTLIEDGPKLAPMQTTYGWQDEYPAPHPFLESLASEGPWYSEMRAIDGCPYSEFWSQCYQCAVPDAWYGVTFDENNVNVTHIGCVRVFQKDADAYTATRVQLEHWIPDSWVGENFTAGFWKKHGDWTGLDGGSWFTLKNNFTVAVAGAHGSAVPSLLGLLGLLLWITQ